MGWNPGCSIIFRSENLIHSQRMWKIPIPLTRPLNEPDLIDIIKNLNVANKVRMYGVKRPFILKGLL